MKVRAFGGDDEVFAAFEAFVQQRSTELLRTARLLTANHSDAEDLLQDALAGLARHWEAVSRDGHPEAYVRRALHNGAIDGWRRRRTRPHVVAEPSEHTPSAGDRFADVDSRLALREALTQLPPRQRAVIVLRYYEQLTEAEAAAVLGCSINTVKSQTRHAMTRLRGLSLEKVLR